MAAEQPREKWVAPASAARNINPIPTSPESVKAGRKVFSDNCVSCHGETGKGDGLLVPHLPVKPANLSSAEVWQQSDGIIFWKVTTGRQPMPNWGAPGEAGLTELKRWNVINYLRASFAPPGSVNPAAPPVAVVPVPAVPVGPPDVLPTTPEETKALLMKLLREQREMRAEIEQLKTGRGGAAPGPTTRTATGPGSPAAVASAPARQDDLE